jgi:phage terminase Nu1 subunit (DNA packaging protein)
MPTKADRTAILPAGLVPLLTQPELETYYGVSEWTVLQWIKEGMPIAPMKTGERRKVRRFDLDEVKQWHAEQMPASA